MVARIRDIAPAIAGLIIVARGARRESAEGPRANTLVPVPRPAACARAGDVAAGARGGAAAAARPAPPATGAGGRGRADRGGVHRDSARRSVEPAPAPPPEPAPAEPHIPARRRLPREPRAEAPAPGADETPAGDPCRTGDRRTRRHAGHARSARLADPRLRRRRSPVPRWRHRSPSAAPWPAGPEAPRPQLRREGGGHGPQRPGPPATWSAATCTRRPSTTCEARSACSVPIRRSSTGINGPRTPSAAA